MTTLTSASSSSLSPSSIQSLMRALILSTKMVFSKWPYVAIAGVVATGFWIIFNVFDQLLFFSPVLFFYLPGDGTIDFIISNITAILMGLIVSMNVYVLVQSKKLKVVWR